MGLQWAISRDLRRSQKIRLTPVQVFWEGGGGDGENHLSVSGRVKVGWVG